MLWLGIQNGLLIVIPYRRQDVIKYSTSSCNKVTLWSIHPQNPIHLTMTFSRNCAVQWILLFSGGPKRGVTNSSLAELILAGIPPPYECFKCCRTRTSITMVELSMALDSTFLLPGPCHGSLSPASALACIAWPTTSARIYLWPIVEVDTDELLP